MSPLLPSLAPLDDQALLAELPRLARSERSATVALVARLAELDARRLYLAAGKSKREVEERSMPDHDHGQP